MDNANLPIEVGLIKAKNEIAAAINQIGSSYSLPSSFVILLVKEIVHESELNVYTNTIYKYDISLPSGLVNDDISFDNSSSEEHIDPSEVTFLTKDSPEGKNAIKKVDSK